jgi:hypothetical protein
MPSTGGYDVMVQVRQEVLDDLLRRLMQPASATGQSDVAERVGAVLHLAPDDRDGFRRLHLAEDPYHLLLWLDRPSLSVRDEQHWLFTAQLAGGAQQTSSGRILSLSGPIQATLRPAIAYRSMPVMIPDAAPVPKHATTLTAELETLALDGVHVRYADIAPPAIAVDQPGILDALRTVLDQQLFSQLARFPLFYQPDSMYFTITPTPSGVGAGPGSPDGNGTHLPAGAGLAPPAPIFNTHLWDYQAASDAVRLFAGDTGNAAVALGFALSRTPGDASLMRPVCTTHPGSNATITFTTAGINQLLFQMAYSNQTLYYTPVWDFPPPGHPRLGFGDPQLTFHPGVCTLQVGVVNGGHHVSVTAQVVPGVSGGGQGLFTVQDLAVEGAIPEYAPDLLQDYIWRAVQHLVQRIFDLLLPRTLKIPGRPLSVPVRLTQIACEEGELTAYGAVATDTLFQAHPPDHLPAAMLHQPIVPEQEMAPSLVSATVEAAITTPSFPPYDYAWQLDASPDLLPDHGASVTISRLVAGGDGSGAQQMLARARLTVIDAFGQVAHQLANVWYQPAQSSVLLPLGTDLDDARASARPRFVALVVGLLLLGATITTLAVLGILGVLKGGSTTYPTGAVAPTATSTSAPSPTLAPTATILPTASPLPSATSAPSSVVDFRVPPPTTFAQTCQSSFTVLPALTVTLDNTRSTVDVAWRVDLDTAPGGTVFWATANPAAGSGVVPAGAQHTLTLTPLSDLCSRMQNASSPIAYHSRMTLTGGGSGTVDLVDTVTPPTPP